MGQTHSKLVISKADKEALNEYSILEEIEKQESNIKIYRIIHKMRKEICVAKFVTDDNFTQGRGDILHIFQGLNNPYVIRCLDTRIIGPDRIGLILEDYLRGENLLSVMEKKKIEGRPFSHEDICQVIVECGRGLKAIHESGVIHRDINPSSIWIINGIYKIGDFTVSIKADSTGTTVGRPDYVAPEIFKGNDYNFKVDVYSLGVILYEMIKLKHPVSAESLPQFAFSSGDCKVKLVSPAHHPRLLDLVRAMMDADSEKRPTMEDILNLDFIPDYILSKKPQS